MKIGLAIDHLDPRRGGAEQWTFQHAERLLARGHEVHVVAEAVSGPAALLPIVQHRLGTMRSQLARAEAAQRALESLDLDVIHDIGMGWYSDVLQSEDGSRIAQWEQKLRLLPRWLRPLKRGMIQILPRYRAFRQLMARQFADPRRIVLAVSKMCAWDYQRYHGVPPERIRLIYHGTDNERFSPAHRLRYRKPLRAQLGIGEEEVMFLFVGHDYRRKGLATAVRAVQRLAAQKQPARLVVVGGKRPRGALGPAAPRHTGPVTIVGAIDDPVPYYAAADAYVLPTFYDPCSLSVSEAAASGLPSVTTRFNGAGELLTEGVDGFVLSDPADDRELAARMNHLMAPALRRQMGEAARKLALEYSLDRNCDEIVALYHEIAQSRAATWVHGPHRSLCNLTSAH